MPRHHVIIGTGVAGIAAAEAIHATDTSAEITLVTKDPHGYYSLPGLAYFLSGEVTDTNLFPYREADFRRLKVKIIKTNVTQINPSDHKVVFEDGKQQGYDRLLLATGGGAVCPDLPGTHFDEVVMLDSLEDARHILKLTRKVGTAVVVGGGITALELVEGLRARGLTVHYLLRGDRYWSNVLDEDGSHIVENKLKADKVQIHYQTELEAIQGTKKHVTGVVTRSGEVIRCGMVAVAIGVAPRKELAEKAGIKTNRGILVNEFLQTNLPDIYAAGDVAEIFDPFSRKFVLDTLWGLARQQGTTAGLNMAGGAAAYHKAVPFNVTRLAGITTTIIGSVGHGRDSDLIAIARGDSETWRENPDAFNAESDVKINHMRLLVGEKTLLGAVVMGDQSLSFPLQVLVSEQIDITPIRSQLIAPGAATMEIIKNFWSRWSKENEIRRA